MTPAKSSAAGLGNFKWHVSVTGARGWGWWGLCRPNNRLLIHYIYIASGKDTLLASPLVVAFGPVRIHILHDGDAVVGEDGEVAGVGRVIGVEG